MTIPDKISIYHIVHVDRLPSIIQDGFLLSDAQLRQRQSAGTDIGMAHIKERRLARLLASHAGLHVGECVPFYFCYRSVMLYIIFKRNNPYLSYREGQEPIVHLVADLHAAVEWADRNGLRWAFTRSNASSSYAEDWAQLSELENIDWDAVNALQWSSAGGGGTKERKQAEFLVETQFPLHLLCKIGVQTKQIAAEVETVLDGAGHRPPVEVLPGWYY